MRKLKVFYLFVLLKFILLTSAKQRILVYTDIDYIDFVNVRIMLDTQ